MPEISSDAELVASALSGDQDAFTRLMARHEKGVLSIALSRLPSLEEAQDAAQETFMRAYLNLSTLRDPGAFRSWVKRIAHGTAIDAARRMQREVLIGDLETAANVGAEESHRPPHGDVVSSQVREALGNLPRLTRLAVILHYTSGYSHAEVAELLGLTPTAVKTRLSRAIGRLRKEMAAMVAGTLAHTVVVYVCSIRVHGKRASVAVGSSGEMSPERRLRTAESCYDLACLDPDLADEPAWRAQRKAALAGTAGILIENALGAGATSMVVSRNGRAEQGNSVGVEAVYSTPAGQGSWSWSSESLWEPLLECFADLAGIRLPQGSGSFSYCFQDKAYALETAIRRDQVRIDIRSCRAQSIAAKTPAASDEPTAVAARIVTAAIEQALRDEANALRARLARNGAEFTIEHSLNHEWHTLLRFAAETKLHIEGKKPKKRGTPTEQPLWQPLREQFAAVCGIQLRDSAKRQSGSLRFGLEGRAHDLGAVFTPKMITLRPLAMPKTVLP
jgi:RNA polymerase sigma-70 factor (ECF subfamily)